MTENGRASPLCLVLEVRAGTADLTRAEAALAGAAAAASLVISPALGRKLAAADVRPLVSLAQERNVAALIADDTELARTARADGVHLSWHKDIEHTYAAARALLGTGAIVGADAGRSRHDAMVLGERGADYIAFGIAAHASDRETARARRRDLIAWWAEVFEPPCVAFDAETAAEGHDLLEAGADFIAFRIPEALPPSRLEAWAKSLCVQPIAAPVE
jgi:thiamine-phosphate pyrophosphorylase